MEPGAQSIAGTFQISKAHDPQSAVWVTVADPSTEAPGVTRIDVQAKVPADIKASMATTVITLIRSLLNT
ncbi:MAG: hypothetical protein BWY85_02054 [Firmicutes bacterium ADurb.Bin506]|nr:MAG: hypothetical protein BWY85_02054 [Firmicutes bacterium ADurb.Bin506]